MSSPWWQARRILPRSRCCRGALQKSQSGEALRELPAVTTKRTQQRPNRTLNGKVWLRNDCGRMTPSLDVLMTSLKQIEANRINARKSTVPRTAEGNNDRGRMPCVMV